MAQSPEKMEELLADLEIIKRKAQLTLKLTRNGLGRMEKDRKVESTARLASNSKPTSKVEIKMPPVIDLTTAERDTTRAQQSNKAAPIDLTGGDASNDANKEHHAARQVRVFLRSLDIDQDRIVTLTKSGNSLMIGRSSSSGVHKLKAGTENAWIESPIVSREHCLLYASFPSEMRSCSTSVLSRSVSDRFQEIYLKDLDSTHGTFLNNKKILANAATRVQTGDRIRLGITVVSGPRTYFPKSFEVRLTWEDKPPPQPSIPTPEDSPKAPAPVRTFSVPVISDSEVESAAQPGRQPTPAPRDHPKEGFSKPEARQAGKAGDSNKPPQQFDAVEAAEPLEKHPQSEKPLSSSSQLSNVPETRLNPQSHVTGAQKEVDGLIDPSDNQDGEDLDAGCEAPDPLSMTKAPRLERTPSVKPAVSIVIPQQVERPRSCSHSPSSVIAQAKTSYAKMDKRASPDCSNNCSKAPSVSDTSQSQCNYDDELSLASDDYISDASGMASQDSEDELFPDHEDEDSLDDVVETGNQLFETASTGARSGNVSSVPSIAGSSSLESASDYPDSENSREEDRVSLQSDSSESSEEPDVEYPTQEEWDLRVGDEIPLIDLDPFVVADRILNQSLARRSPDGSTREEKKEVVDEAARASAEILHGLRSSLEKPTPSRDVDGSEDQAPFRPSRKDPIAEHWASERSRLSDVQDLMPYTDGPFTVLPELHNQTWDNILQDAEEPVPVPLRQFTPPIVVTSNTEPPSTTTHVVNEALRESAKPTRVAISDLVNCSSGTSAQIQASDAVPNQTGGIGIFSSVDPIAGTHQSAQVFEDSLDSSAGAYSFPDAQPREDLDPVLTGPMWLDYQDSQSVHPPSWRTPIKRCAGVPEASVCRSSVDAAYLKHLNDSNTLLQPRSPGYSRRALQHFSRASLSAADGSQMSTHTQNHSEQLPLKTQPAGLRPSYVPSGQVKSEVGIMKRCNEPDEASQRKKARIDLSESSLSRNTTEPSAAESVYSAQEEFGQPAAKKRSAVIIGSSTESSRASTPSPEIKDAASVAATKPTTAAMVAAELSPRRRQDNTSGPNQRSVRSRASRRPAWRSFMTGALAGAVTVLGAAAALIATVPPEVREEALREF